MLTITVPGLEVYDEETETFSTIGDIQLQFEHSLLSLSKWESEYQKPFLGKEEKTAEELLGYVKAMIVTPNFPPDIFSKLTQKNLDEINDYINSKQSATTFGQMPETKGRGETITSELIYYWMVAFNIPFEVETWHLNRLFSLIRICNVKQSKPKKIPKNQIAARNRELNAQRKQQLGTSG